MESKLSHYDESGKVSMVDVGAKAESERNATARAYIALNKEVLAALPQNKKGNPLEVARIAGIMAAKKTSDLIPLCHPLPLTKVNIELTQDENGIEIVATASTVARTGVEMEAMTAACVAALTIYDMTKALDKSIEIREIHLLEKTGGKSGTFRRQDRK
jgi:cyclic pyranopterin phosphate synthase